ncbi:MAG: glycosyltransferase [bacterium]|nr:glycosyltransferase [bacterium]
MGYNLGAMFALLHGYHLGGSGSNYWTRYMARALCQLGESFLLACLEENPEDFDFISHVYEARSGEKPRLLLERETPYPGRCHFLRLPIGKILPVYVSDYLRPGSITLPMTKMTDTQIENYLQEMEEVLKEAVPFFNITAFHANHAVLLSVVAQRLGAINKLPYTVMPHGSALEYVVKKDPRYFRLAESALQNARKIFCLGQEMEVRLLNIFPTLPPLEKRLRKITLGVDTQAFQPVPRNERGPKIRQLIAEIGNFGKREKATRKPLPTAGKALGRMDWKQEKIILHVGALLPNKGLPVLLETLPEVLKRIPQAKLLIVGSGPLLEELKHQYRNWKDRFEFLGYFPHDLLRLLFPCADVAVFPSLIPEAGPLVFLEALASGVLPLGTDAGGMRGFFRTMEGSIPRKEVNKMRLDRDPKKIKAGLSKAIPWALETGEEFSPLLRRVAVENFDWKVPAEIFRKTLHLLGSGNAQNLQTHPKNGLET